MAVTFLLNAVTNFCPIRTFPASTYWSAISPPTVNVTMLVAAWLPRPGVDWIAACASWAISPSMRLTLIHSGVYRYGLRNFLNMTAA